MRRKNMQNTTAAGAAAGAPGFVWGSFSAVLSRVFTSRVSAPGFVWGSYSAALALGSLVRAKTKIEADASGEYR